MRELTVEQTELSLSLTTPFSSPEGSALQAASERERESRSRQGKARGCLLTVEQTEL